MTEFDQTQFELNPKPYHRFFNTSWGEVIVTDHFYNDPSGVREEAAKLPVSRTVYDSPDMFDARATWLQSITGNELAFTNVWLQFLANRYDVDVTCEWQTPTILINVNKILSPKHQEYFFCPHRDPGELTTIVFLNDEYLKGDGFNIYKDDKIDEEQWVRRGESLVPEVFVQGKCNRAVTFKSAALHGMEVKTPYFASQNRLTQAIFTRKAE